MTVFEADWFCPISSPPVKNGSIAVDGGCIVENSGDGVRFRFSGCAIIPGFVNAHTHIELTILRGFLEDLPFIDWIRRLTRAKYKDLTRDEMLLSARMGAADMIAAGVTCVGEVMDLGVAWEAMKEFGLQGIAYQEVFGPQERLAQEQFEELRQKVAKLRSEETVTRRAGVSPHAPYTVSPKLYRAVADYARSESLPLTTHIAESQDEGLFVRFGAGPFAESFAQRGIELPPTGLSPVAYLESLGLVTAENLLVHLIDLEEDDFKILEKHRPKIVHCPKSNAKLGHGVARVTDMREMGLTLGLGSDSVAGNNAVDMFEEMRSAIFQQRSRTGRLDALDATAAFHMATLGGAECLGLAHLFGSLEPGKRADFVVVNLNDIAVQPVYDPIETMVYSASRHNVRATYIGGVEVKIDTQEMVREAQPIAARLRG